MAIVGSPFFSTFASGSIKKTLTCNAHYQGGKFVMQMYKRRSGKRHPIQIHNAQVFKERAQAMTRMANIFKEE